MAVNKNKNIKMPQINSIKGLSGIKVISKCDVNPTSGFQDIAFTSNCQWTDRWLDGRTDGPTARRTGPFYNHPVFRQAYKNVQMLSVTRKYNPECYSM